MRSTEIVIEDHALIRRSLIVFDGMLNQLENGQRIEIADIAALVKFLRVFAEQYHQATEEAFLFPALVQSALPEPALRRLAAEHAEEESLLAEVEEAFMSRRGMPFFRSSRRLIALLRNHCSQEESIIPDLAERWLSTAQDERIAAEFLKNRQLAETCVSFPRLESKYLPMPARERALAHSQEVSGVHTL